MGHQAELHGQIVKGGVGGVHLHAAFRQIGVAEAHAYIEEERECVDSGIRGRVEEVDLVTIVYAYSCASHTFARASFHACQLTESEPGIG